MLSRPCFPLQVRSCAVWRGCLSGVCVDTPLLIVLLRCVARHLTQPLTQTRHTPRQPTHLLYTCATTANVFRDGKRITLDADQLVPGDIVSIKSGDRLPADMRLLEVANLQVGAVCVFVCLFVGFGVCHAHSCVLSCGAAAPALDVCWGLRFSGCHPAINLLPNTRLPTATNTNT